MLYTPHTYFQSENSHLAQVLQIGYCLQKGDRLEEMPLAAMVCEQSLDIVTVRLKVLTSAAPLRRHSRNCMNVLTDKVICRGRFAT